jgi:hypothetical protein
MKIAVYCKNEFLGEDGKTPFWVGDAERIGEIRNHTARELAAETAKHGKPCRHQMWSSDVVDPLS